MSVPFSIVLNKLAGWGTIFMLLHGNVTWHWEQAALPSPTGGKDVILTQLSLSEATPSHGAFQLRAVHWRQCQSLSNKSSVSKGNLDGVLCGPLYLVRFKILSIGTNALILYYLELHLKKCSVWWPSWETKIMTTKCDAGSTTTKGKTLTFI